MAARQARLPSAGQWTHGNSGFYEHRVCGRLSFRPIKTRRSASLVRLREFFIGFFFFFFRSEFSSVACSSHPHYLTVAKDLSSGPEA